MAQASNYPSGNNGGYPPPSSSSPGNAAPAAAPVGGPNPAAGPVAVATSLLQHHQQHPQVNYLQQLQQQQQQQHQHPKQHPQQQCQQQQQPPPPQPQQFIPGPFYTLQQQQAFSQARLAAAAAQAQQQQQQQQAQQQATQVQQQLQQHAAYSFMGQQQQQPQPIQQLQPMVNPNAAVTGGMAGLHSTSPSAAALPVLNYNHTNTAAVTANAASGTPSSAASTAAATAPVTTSKRRKQPSPDIVNAPSGAATNKPSPPTPRSNKAPAAAPAPSNKVNAKALSSDSAKQQQAVSLPPSADSLTHGMSSTAAQLIRNAMAESNSCDIPAASTSPSASVGPDDIRNHRPLTAEEKKQSSRDRNREHARCTRLRKKAYVNKLKELVDGLHAERSEDARKRRVAVQHLAEIQGLRRKVVNTFLGYHSGYERDHNKWGTILERDFWLKQPVTPYRSFRRCEIQKGSRILKGVDAMIRDAASMSVMIETIGSRNLRWMQRKRDDFLTRGASKHASAGGRMARRISSRGQILPHSIDRRNSRLQHAISSLSSSGSSTGAGSGTEEERRLAQRRKTQGKGGGEHRGGHHGTEEKHHNPKSDSTAKKVSSSSSGSDDAHQLLRSDPPSNDFHDYHAPALPDPLPEPGESSSPSSDSPQDIDSDNCVVGKHMCTDSSSGDEEKMPSINTNANPQKKRKTIGDEINTVAVSSQSNLASTTAQQAGLSGTAAAKLPSLPNLPPNIARSGGIRHNVKAVVQLPQPAAMARASPARTASFPNGYANLSRAPATALPPFAGIGKRKHPLANQQTGGSAQNDDKSHHPIAATSSSALLPSGSALPPVAHHAGSQQIGNNNSSNHRNNEEEENHNKSNNSNMLSSRRGNIITINNDFTSTSSQSSSQSCRRGISAHYHINEDDMISTGDILMCPFIFRSQEAVWCGALAECVQPGMLRATFSKTNKLRNVEMVFDAMGFCQQLERASGNEGMAQIIPNSLEMALGTPSSDEMARVITLAKGPDFGIVSVNEAFTRVTGYTQLDVEGKDVRTVLSEDSAGGAGPRTTTVHDFESVARKGVCAASTNMHYDRNGREFLDFMCSYPLSNLRDEVTHILHVCQELPARE